MSCRTKMKLIFLGETSLATGIGNIWHHILEFGRHFDSVDQLAN